MKRLATATGAPGRRAGCTSPSSISWSVTSLSLPESQRVRVAETGPGTANPPEIAVEGRRVVVWNLDPAESEIERFTVEQFRELFHLAEADVGAKEASAAGARPPGSERPGRGLPAASGRTRCGCMSCGRCS
jgi:hypothetical protein